MKILQVNKFYYQKGGAERCFLDTINILKQNGHEVAVFSMDHPDNNKSKWNKYFVNEIDYYKKQSFLKKIVLGFKIIYNREAVKKIDKLIKDFRPDVVHLHNIYHQLSPSIIIKIKKYNIPVVMTLHDYKVINPNYNMYLNNKIWEGCKRGRFYQCLQSRCIKNSFAKSFIGVCEAYIHSRTYKKVDLFLAPSMFLKNKFKEYGFTGNIIHLPYAFVNKKNQDIFVNSFQNYILYAGRLSEEKGIKTLISAINKVENSRDLKLIIAGDGPQKKELVELIKKLKLDERVIFLGHQKTDRLFSLIKGAKAAVIPSEWYENLPYAVIESMALTKIVICSKLGGLSEMVENGKTGFLFKPADPISLVNAINKVLCLNAEKKSAIEQYAKETATAKYSPIKYYQSLISCYQDLLDERKDKAIIDFKYGIGLLITALNRTRHLFYSYSNPRPISGKKIQENTDYDLRVVKNFESRLKQANVNLKNKKVLEIGPGPDLGIGLLFIKKGVKLYAAVDRFKLLAVNNRFYNKFLDGKINKLVELIKLSIVHKKEIDEPNFKYINAPVEKMSARLKTKYDIIMSQAALEHVDRDKMRKAFEEMYKVLNREGVVCHEIDFQTHTSILRDWDPLNILRYSEGLYKKISFPGSPNRLRINDYIKIAQEVGFKNITANNLNTLTPLQVDKVKNKLAHPFNRYATEDLQVLSAMITAKK